MILVVDNTMGQDQYFPRLLKVLSSCDSKFKVIKSKSDLRYIKAKEVKGLILSGSPLMVTEEDIDNNVEQFMLNAICIKRYDVPILGICFGCQLLNFIGGGKLIKLRSHFCADREVQIRRGKKVKGRFCLRYIIQEVAPSFDTLGVTEIRGNKVACLIKHKKSDVYGCLFHPEYHPETHYLIKDFIRVCDST